MTDVFDCPARRLDVDELIALEPALKPGLAGGWYYRRRRPPPPRQADESLAEGPGSRRGDDPRELRIPRLRRDERPGLVGTDRTGRDVRRYLHRRHRRLDAAPERSARLPGSDPAGKGVQPDDAPARGMPTDPLDLPRDPRCRHAVPVGLPPGLDHGVRRLRRIDPPRTAPAPQGRCGPLSPASPTASPSRKSGSAGGR